VAGVRWAERAVALALAGALVVCLAACASGSGGASADPDRRTEAQTVLGPAAVGAPNANANADGPRARGWAVLLERAASADHERIARQRAADIRRALGRPDVSTRPVDGGTAIVLGSFASHDSPAALAALEYAKTLEVNGRRPFARAFLVPPPFDDAGGTPRFNLRNAADNAARPVAYTLQVEQYDDEDRALRARVAEQRVIELRQQGEQAFYHHGPRFSIVTVGLFGPGEWNPTFREASPRIQQAQQRFPQMLLNGAPLRMRNARTGEALGGFAGTFLVRVPGGADDR
jgi:hypothetical protein